MEEKKYVTEWANENLGLTLKITNMVHEEQTPFQHIEIADTLEYGRLLILDGVFQTSVKDEWTLESGRADPGAGNHRCFLGRGGRPGAGGL